jgi:mono/diheme cytochrome c family protein
MYPASTGRIALLAACLNLTAWPTGAAEDRAAAPSTAPQPTVGEPGTAEPEIDVKKLFAAQCGWCHADYGMKAGKAPQLAGTRLNEQQVFNTIRNGKVDVMPSFRRSLTEEQIRAFAKYIKGLPAQQ